MKIKSQRDFWSGLMFMIVGVVFAWGSTYYSMGASARPGPGYLPFGLGVLMAVLGGMVLFKALTLEVEGGDPIGAWAWRPLLIVNGAAFVFGWAIPHLGMFIALPLLVIASSLTGHSFRWQDAIINSVVLTIGSWVIFIWGLKLTIPLLPWFMAG